MKFGIARRDGSGRDSSSLKEILVLELYHTVLSVMVFLVEKEFLKMYRQLAPKHKNIHDQNESLGKKHELTAG